MKLIRDKIALTPTVPDRRTIILSDKETQTSLIFDKLIEEAHEVFNARNLDEIIEELADMSEVTMKLMELHGITYEQVNERRRQKKELKGAYEGGFVLL